jgi:hypothetical protein
LRQPLMANHSAPQRGFVLHHEGQLPSKGIMRDNFGESSASRPTTCCVVLVLR